MLAKLWDKLLSEKGYQVTIMTESPEALKLFTANPDHFDLVITDQTMPGVTGEELIQKLKKSDLTCERFSVPDTAVRLMKIRQDNK
jgi:CheY-like chemotaxis protein